MDTLDLKYRPTEYSEVLPGNEKAISQLSEGEPVRSYVLHGPSGSGKAQPLYSKVLTPNGFISMGDVKVGDTVITDSGAHAPVVGVYPQGVRDIYEITLQDKTKIRVSDHHLNKVYTAKNFSVGGIKRTKKEYQVLDTLELIEFMENHKGKVRIDTPVVEFNYKKVELDPYLLGALIGDGGLHKSMMFSNSEEDVVEMVNDILKRDFNMKLSKSVNFDYRISYINRPNHAGNRGDRGLHDVHRNYDLDATLRGKIMNLGLDCLSKDKFIPSEYLYNTRDVRLGVLQGLMDTDGHTDSMGAVEFSTSSRQLSDDFTVLARSLGIRVTVSTKVPTIGDKEYGLHYRHYMHIPNNLEYFRSDKHRSRRTFRQNPQLRNIESIQFVGREECQCIMVGHDDHTYISDDFIPTHNTTLVRIFAKGIDAEVLEFDAASLGKADIETIKEVAQHESMFNQYKIIILDEAHTLSTQAKDALLKAIEEGNRRTIWAMCTTEVNKIADAIQTRSRIVEIKRTSNSVVEEHLKSISEKEGLEMNSETEYAIREIAGFADGKVRQSIKLLETYITTGVLDLPNSQKDSVRLLTATYDGDIETISKMVENFTNADVFNLIKTVSDFITAFALIPQYKEKGGMAAAMQERTSLSVNLMDELRELTSVISSTIQVPAEGGQAKIINRLFMLHEALMRNYNNFTDNRYNIKTTLIWYSSQLETWRINGQ